MLPASWAPVAAGDILRVGPDGDSGYYLSARALEETTLLLSFGLGYDWGFEADFLSRSDARAICYDASVTPRFWAKLAILSLLQGNFARMVKYFPYRRFFSGPRARHKRLFIGHDRPGWVSLGTILKRFLDQRIFLKSDIEGGEYRMLDTIVANQHRFTGIAIELHDIDLHRDRLTAFFAAMGDFRIIAMNPNNYGGTDGNGDPLVIEVAMTHRSLLSQGERALPARQANDPSVREIELAYER